MKLKVLFLLNCESSKYIAKLFSLSIHLGGSCAWGNVCKYAIGIFVHVIDICVHKRFGPQFEYKYKSDSAIGRRRITRA